jgi:hypothetical protein
MPGINGVLYSRNVGCYVVLAGGSINWNDLLNRSQMQPIDVVTDESIPVLIPG